MIKIISSAQTRELDAYTMAHEPILSIDLMERACRAFVAWFTGKVDSGCSVGIVCGTGNNGGDGLGIARLLSQHGYKVSVWIVRGTVPESPDFKINLERLSFTAVVPQTIDTPFANTIFSGHDVLVDAIFGSGISRPVDGVYAKVIEAMNATPVKRIAVDIPSGLKADDVLDGPMVKADATVSFQLPKFCFFLPQFHNVVGTWATVDIGLSKTFIKSLPGDHFFVNRKSVRKMLRRRSAFDHKGDNGHALLVVGSEGRMGAAVLSARAALRAGLGLLTIHAPRAGYSILQTAVPEAMVSIDAHPAQFSESPATDTYTTLGIGPGLGKSAPTAKALALLLENFQKPVVLDADALNILAENREMLHVVPKGSILTPHPKEFERLVGKWKNDFERVAKQKQLAAQLNAVVLVKGAFTTIASPEGKIYFNSTGNPGMATGGTGDVLTGILTGLLAQRYASLDAAILGVYLHGLAGDLAAEQKGMHSLIASDVVDFLSEAFLRLG